MMLEELVYMGYLKTPPQGESAITGTEKLARVNDLLSASRTRVQIELPTTLYNGPLDVSQKTIGKYLDQIRMLVRPKMAPYSYTSEKYLKEVPVVIDCLVQGVAPVEARVDGVFRANSIAAILNGGWEIYKSDIQSFYNHFRETVPIQDRLANFNQLLFKAMEASEVVRLWQKT